MVAECGEQDGVGPGPVHPQVEFGPAALGGEDAGEVADTGEVGAARAGEDDHRVRTRRRRIRRPRAGVGAAGDPSVGDGVHGGGVRPGEGLAVVRERHGPAGGGRLGEDRGEHAVGGGVEAGPRFVEDEQVGRYEQGLRERDLLSVALGEGAQFGVGAADEGEPVQQQAGAGPGGGGGQAADAAEVGEVGDGGEAFVGGEAVGDVADGGPRGRDRSGAAAGGGAGEAGQDP